MPGQYWLSSLLAQTISASANDESGEGGLGASTAGAKLRLTWRLEVLELRGVGTVPSVAVASQLLESLINIVIVLL